MIAKRILIGTILIFSAAAANAQPHVQENISLTDASNNSSINDTIVVKMKPEGKVIIIEQNEDGTTREVIYHERQSKKRKPSRVSYGLLFDIGFNTYDNQNFISGAEGNDPFLSLRTGKSANVALYPFYGELRLTKRNILSLQTAIGFDWGNYRFEHGWTISNNNGTTVADDRFRPGGQSILSKSKLTTVYLNVPLMVKFNIPVDGKNRDGIYISAGVIGGLKLGSHTKVKYSDGGKKEKDHGSFNLNMLRYSLTLRAGYKDFGVFVNYQMTPMFKNGKGPELYPYSAGLSITI